MELFPPSLEYTSYMEMKIYIYVYLCWCNILYRAQANLCSTCVVALMRNLLKRVKCSLLEFLIFESYAKALSPTIFFLYFFNIIFLFNSFQNTWYICMDKYIFLFFYFHGKYMEFVVYSWMFMQFFSFKCFFFLFISVTSIIFPFNLFSIW